MTCRLALLAALCLALVACGGVAPAEHGPANGPVTASRADGRYTLRIDLPKTSWIAGEDLTGAAALILQPGTDEMVSGSGGLLGFSFTEVGGSRVMGPVFTSDCAPHPLAVAQPLVAPLAKSGGWADDQADAAFYRAFFTQPGIHLPAGDWDVAAQTEFFDGRGCDGAKHDLRATVRIHVSDGASPSPGG